MAPVPQPHVQGCNQKFDIDSHNIQDLGSNSKSGYERTTLWPRNCLLTLIPLYPSLLFEGLWPLSHEDMSKQVQRPERR